MANEVPFSLKAVSKDPAVFKHLLDILQYKDTEYFLYRVFAADMMEIEDAGGGYFTCEYFGNVAWGCTPWISDKENKKDIHEPTGSHYTNLLQLAKRLHFGFELYCADCDMGFQKYWRVNAKGKLVDTDIAEDWKCDIDTDKESGGLDYYGQFSEPREVYEEESKLKGKWVWAVVGADPRSDDSAYLAYVQIFADREEARKCLRQSAKEDAECFEDKVEWHDCDTDSEWCEIYCGGESRIVYSLEAIKIK